MPIRERPPLAVMESPERHLRRIIRKLAVLFVVVVVVVLGGAALYAKLEHDLPFLDSLYNVVMLMTAIGSSRDPVTVEGKWFNIFLSMFSVAMMIGVMTQIGQLLLRREFLTVLSDWRHRKMKDHTIICGVSHTTHELLNRLPVDHVVVLVKSHDDAHRIQREREGIQVHVCDYTSSVALKHANVEHAALLIAASESDADNAFTCLTAKHLKKDLKVITRMSRTENREKMEEVGSDAIISPAELAANAVMAKIAEFEGTK
ncbi:MAG: potassium channel family protein [Planctomycetota bacterium]